MKEILLILGIAIGFFIFCAGINLFRKKSNKSKGTRIRIRFSFKNGIEIYYSDF